MCGTSNHLVLLRINTSDIGLDGGSMKFLGYREVRNINYCFRPTLGTLSGQQLKLVIAACLLNDPQVI
jgi:hypothetical protein